MSKLFLKPNEAAALLGIGKTTMYELLKSNVISHVRVGRKLILIHREKLQHWADTQQGQIMRTSPPDSPAPKKTGGRRRTAQSPEAA
jgi:excisionase family DNA binding protein